MGENQEMSIKQKQKIKEQQEIISQLQKKIAKLSTNSNMFMEIQFLPVKVKVTGLLQNTKELDKENQNE